MTRIVISYRPSVSNRREALLLEPVLNSFLWVQNVTAMQSVTMQYATVENVAESVQRMRNVRPIGIVTIVNGIPASSIIAACHSWKTTASATGLGNAHLDTVLVHLASKLVDYVTKAKYVLITEIVQQAYVQIHRGPGGIVYIVSMTRVVTRRSSVIGCLIMQLLLKEIVEKSFLIMKIATAILRVPVEHV